LITGCGQGNIDYLIPGVLGFLTGGVIFGATYQSIFLKIQNIGAYGQKTFEDLFNVNHWLFISFFVLCTIVFYLGSKITEKSKSVPQEQINNLNLK